MASRQEEKEQRRRERLEAEQREAKAAGSRRRLQLVGGAVLALAALAAIAIALVTVLGGGDDADPKKPAGGEQSRQAAAKLPTQQLTDLGAAAKAAGCTVTNPKFEGQEHEDGKRFAATDYGTNPPTSGNHNPSWYEDGIYTPGTTPKLGELVHTLEHGRIDVQYKPGTPKSVTDQLEAFVGENDGYHMVMFENTTKMPFAVAATAWTHSLTCEDMNPKVFDALRTFRDQYIDKGPEKIP